MNLIEQDLDDKGILTLTLNRPEKLNVLSTEVLIALDELISAAKVNPKVKALMITGQGKAFCAGADINKLKECTVQSGYEFACLGQKVFNQIENLGKPSLAAVNGFAFGGGCELAISTTLRTASTEALFGQPEVKLGVIPGYGGTQRLPRLIGKGRALDLCLTGRFINADLALQWGLVSEVTEADNLISRSKAILTTILYMAPKAIQAVMDVMNADHLSLQDGLHLEASQFAMVCATADKKEGVNAFLEKRTPEFEGL